jgi:hypothetical protein
MGPGHALERRADLAILALVALALLLLVVGGATGLQRLSVRWSTACHRLVHAPNPPRFVQPWRVSAAQPEAACPPRLPRLP